ncbi:MAG: hypothetical protein ACOY30_15340 [Bacillota bacterium]
MHCQLDEVKQILYVASAARNAVLQEFPESSGPGGFSLESGSLVFGLLLLGGHDVFMQKGVISINGKNHDHYWVEVYLDGEAFILDVALAQFGGGQDERMPEVLFMSKDEAAGEYGYAHGKDYDWRREDCEEKVWQAALDMLEINKPLSQVFKEIED